jgi:hypothetical protein
MLGSINLVFGWIVLDFHMFCVHPLKGNCKAK